MCRSISGIKQIGVVFAILCAPSWLFAQTQTYTVTELTNPVGGFVQGGDNVREYVGGALSTPESALLWTSPTTPTTLVPLSGSAGSALAFAINDAGQVVGTSSIDSSGNTRATLWQGSSVKDLGILPGYRSSKATAINSAGAAAGVGISSAAVDIEGNPIDHALLFSNGSVIDLGTLGGSSSVANGINSAEQIIGWSNIPSDTNPPSHATLWQANVSTDLGTLGGTNSFAMAINEEGVIVGESDLPGLNSAGRTSTHATMWKDGVATDLGTLGSGTLSNAFAINSGGDIVGISDTFPDNTSPQDVQHAVLWSKGQIIDLNTKLPADLQAQVVLEYAQAIADDGSIVAEARSQGTGSCCSRIFLLTPVSPLAVSCPTSSAQLTTAYSSAAIASGGVPPYVYLIAGSLPPGLALAAHTGAITGTPTASGTFNFTVQATDSSSGTPTAATHSCTISVTPRPDFSLDASTSVLKVSPGSQGSVVISVAAMNGFTGAVALGVSRAPAGASFSLKPPSLRGAQASTLTINTGTAALGTYSIVVTGNSGGITHSTAVTLTIVAATSHLTVSPTSLSFGKVHRYALKIKQIEVTNLGTTLASIGEQYIEGGEEARRSFVLISFCGHTLQPAHNCRIIVIFVAEYVGRFSATLEISAKTANPLTVALSAEVIPPRK
jgi:probable HAF family extracellular repeat protein